MEQKSNTFPETQPIGSLMAKYAIPCVISLLVAALIVELFLWQLIGIFGAPTAKAAHSAA